MYLSVKAVLNKYELTSDQRLTIPQNVVDVLDRFYMNIHEHTSRYRKSQSGKPSSQALLLSPHYVHVTSPMYGALVNTSTPKRKTLIKVLNDNKYRIDYNHVMLVYGIGKLILRNHGLLDTELVLLKLIGITLRMYMETSAYFDGKHPTRRTATNRRGVQTVDPLEGYKKILADFDYHVRELQVPDEDEDEDEDEDGNGNGNDRRPTGRGAPPGTGQPPPGTGQPPPQPLAGGSIELFNHVFDHVAADWTTLDEKNTWLVVGKYLANFNYGLSTKAVKDITNKVRTLIYDILSEAECEAFFANPPLPEPTRKGNKKPSKDDYINNYLNLLPTTIESIVNDICNYAIEATNQPHDIWVRSELIHGIQLPNIYYNAVGLITHNQPTERLPYVDDPPPGYKQDPRSTFKRSRSDIPTSNVPNILGHNPNWPSLGLYEDLLGTKVYRMFIKYKYDDVYKSTSSKTEAHQLARLDHAVSLAGYDSKLFLDMYTKRFSSLTKNQTIFTRYMVDKIVEGATEAQKEVEEIRTVNPDSFGLNIKVLATYPYMLDDYDFTYARLIEMRPTDNVGSKHPLSYQFYICRDYIPATIYDKRNKEAGMYESKDKLLISKHILYRKPYYRAKVPNDIYLLVKDESTVLIKMSDDPVSPDTIMYGLCDPIYLRTLPEEMLLIFAKMIENIADTTIASYLAVIMREALELESLSWLYTANPQLTTKFIHSHKVDNIINMQLDYNDGYYGNYDRSIEQSFYYTATATATATATEELFMRCPVEIKKDDKIWATSNQLFALY